MQYADGLSGNCFTGPRNYQHDFEVYWSCMIILCGTMIWVVSKSQLHVQPSNPSQLPVLRAAPAWRDAPALLQEEQLCLRRPWNSKDLSETVASKKLVQCKDGFPKMVLGLEAVSRMVLDSRGRTKPSRICWSHYCGCWPDVLISEMKASMG